MVVNINKIIVKDRIRKDFGDIQELADDIKQNGLINPPVINRDYELLAGERRLRACKSLGWNQIEVRMMDTRDAEHELNVEISENEVRKDFTKSERVDYMKRVFLIEQAKAKERMKSGKRTPKESSGKTRDITAKRFGISGVTMEQEIAIVNNKNLFTSEDFEDWDRGKISTHKAFTKLDKILREKSGKILVDKNSYVKRMRAELTESFTNNFINSIGECQICGNKCVPILQVHHILPISKFGNNDYENLKCLCPNCRQAVSFLYDEDINSIQRKIPLISPFYTVDEMEKISSILNKYIDSYLDHTSKEYAKVLERLCS